MAATYRHIPDFYPSKVGAVGGIVGALGGLGGFILPRYLCAPMEALLGLVRRRFYRSPASPGLPLRLN